MNKEQAAKILEKDPDFFKRAGMKGGKAKAKVSDAGQFKKGDPRTKDLSRKGLSSRWGT